MMSAIFPDIDMFGHDNRRCDNLFAWFVINKMIIFFLERMGVVQRRNIEELYTGSFGRIFV